MDDLLLKPAWCIKYGKIDKSSPYAPDIKGQHGADFYYPGLQGAVIFMR
jgi:hypothetical protein